MRKAWLFIWQRTYRVLQKLGYASRICAFCDNSYEAYDSQEVYGLKVLSLDDVAEEYENMVFVIATQKYWPKIYQQLLTYGIDRENIFVSCHTRLVAGRWKEQYFDLAEMKKVKGEIFVDAGAFDGMTSQIFTEWAGNEYEKIYMFEPNPRCKKICEKNIEKYHIKNVEFIHKGTQNENRVLHFASDDLAGSSINRNGEAEAEMTRVDNVLKGRPATFIKMDVEGSEKESLLGAKDTIKKYHPKLAICVYHKFEDIIDIPQCILEIEKGYKFYLRHYSSCEWETVLYAIYDEDN